jgi:hypothetical protein
LGSPLIELSATLMVLRPSAPAEGQPARQPANVEGQVAGCLRRHNPLISKPFAA